MWLWLPVTLPLAVWLLAALLRPVDDPHRIDALLWLGLRLVALGALLLLAGAAATQALLASLGVVTALHLLSFFALRGLLRGGVLRARSED